MALLYCSSVFFEVSQCCFQASWRVYPLLRMWQRALDQLFPRPLVISQIISWHTPTLPNSICPHNDDSTRSIHSMMRVVLVFKDPHGSIWPMIVAMQNWFTIVNLLIQDHQYFAVQPLWEGCASLQLWFHAFELRLQWTSSSITITTIMIYRRNLE